MAPRSVLLFGLSADPPTGSTGHAGIVTWGAHTLGVDEVWILPVFQHAFAEKQQMTPYPHRLAMARLAFEHLPGLEGRVRVLETEREVTERMQAEATRAGEPEAEVWAGTIDVVTELRRRFPDTRFSLVLGADTYRDYVQGRWKGGRALEALVEVVGVPRVGIALPVGPHMPAGRTGLPPPHLGTISSTALRSSRDPTLWAQVHPDVRAYAKKHKLYGLAQ